MTKFAEEQKLWKTCGSVLHVHTYPQETGTLNHILIELLPRKFWNVSCRTVLVTRCSNNFYHHTVKLTYCFLTLNNNAYDARYGSVNKRCLYNHISERHKVIHHTVFWSNIAIVFLFQVYDANARFFFGFFQASYFYHYDMRTEPGEFITSNGFMWKVWM